MPTFDSTNPHRFQYDPIAGVCYCRLDFLGYPGYCVGDDGSVWSCRIMGRYYGVGTRWRKLKSTPSGRCGHLYVALCSGKGTKPKSHLAHVLVLTAFVGPCPPECETCHFPDRNPANNCIDNLRWGTPAANQKDRIVHGTDLRGAKHPSARFTVEEIHKIRDRYARKWTIWQIATAHKASYGVIQRIVLRRSYFNC